MFLGDIARIIYDRSNTNTMTREKLRDMFISQYKFQMANYPNGIFKNVQYIKDMTLAAQIELGEMIQETPWKPWKKEQQWDIDKAREELIDVQHFIINLALALGLGPEDFYERFKAKHKENWKRRHRGY